MKDSLQLGFYGKAAGIVSVVLSLVILIFVLITPGELFARLIFTVTISPIFLMFWFIDFVSIKNRRIYVKNVFKRTLQYKAEEFIKVEAILPIVSILRIRLKKEKSHLFFGVKDEELIETLRLLK